MPLWLLALAQIAAAKLLAGLAATAILFPLPGEPDWTRALVKTGSCLVFVASAVILLAAGRRDRRAVCLGVVFLAVASSLAAPPLEALAVMQTGLAASFLELLDQVNVEAFLPLLLWVFFRDFPSARSLGFARQPPRGVIGGAAAVGLVLVALDLAVLLGPASLGRGLESDGYGTLYWAVVSTLSLGALAWGVWRSRLASTGEKRRMRFLLAGLALGAGPPLLVFLIAAVSPAVASVVRDPYDPYGVSLGLFAVPAIMPIATTYAVLVEHVMGVRLVVRKALRYALARYTVIAATLVPVVAVAVHLYLQRARPLAETLSGQTAVVLLALTAAGLVTLRLRGGILTRIDRHFFREHFDAERLLRDLVVRCRSIRSVGQLERELVESLDAALHLESIAVLLLDRGRGVFRSPSRASRPLPTSALLARLLAGSAEPLDVGLGGASSSLARLPHDERQYLADGGWRLLAPMVGATGELAGFIALGDKRSELGYSAEDRSLLASVATSAAVTFEHLASASSGGMAEPTLEAESSDQTLAGGCASCDVVYPWERSRCTRCGTELEPLGLPHVVNGKYRLERRLGAGGMAVVYLAHDLALGRPVAVKTLPRLSPERSLRLRREARAMASLTHPNLAMIYGYETWRGVPFLVLEYLSGGTLAARLRRGRLPVAETVELGCALAAVIEEAHEHGVLHRDIKPSNIGFGRDGAPKLLDFGLAKVLVDLLLDELEASRSGESNLAASVGATLSLPALASQLSHERGGFVGTLAYAAPEAIAGRRPHPSFDLWSLALVLGECLAGENPQSAATSRGSVERIVEHSVCPVWEEVSGCPPELAALLESALDLDPGRRPASVREFRTRLEGVRGLALETA
jgi:hypothetical protein